MHKSKTLLAAISALVLIALLVGCGGPAPTQTPTGTPTPTPTTSPPAKVYKARFASWQIQQDIRSVYVQKFIDRVKDKTGGQVDISPYWAGSLFAINDIIPAVGKGAVEGGLMGGGVLPNYVGAYYLEAIWYLLTLQQTLDVWQTTDAGKAATKNLETQLNSVVASRVLLGGSPFFTTKQVKKLEDFTGLKARSLSPAQRAIYEALGMKPVSVSTEEVFSAFQSGMIEGVGTNYSSMKNFGWWDFGKFALKPEYSYTTALVTFNATWWNTLPKTLQDQILEVGKALTPEAFDATVKEDLVTEDTFVKTKGGAVYALPDAERFRIVKLLKEKGAYDTFSKAMGQELWDAAVKVSGVKF